MELRAATYNVSLAQSEGFFEEAAQKSSCFGLGHSQRIFFHSSVSFGRYMCHLMKCIFDGKNMRCKQLGLFTRNTGAQKNARSLSDLLIAWLALISAEFVGLL